MSGASEKVLGWVKNGVPCYWKEGEPTPWNLGTSMEDATEEEVEWLGRETTRCVEVGAWEEVDSLYCSSRVFLVPKKELDSQGRKKWRLIIDLLAPAADGQRHRGGPMGQRVGVSARAARFHAHRAFGLACDL